ncbi:transferase [beta proteobacterium AAP121]|nr:transferase [beta proteobacterium AAP65]KPF96114.1 transferase [beta proteobacterium AAP121]
MKAHAATPPARVLLVHNAYQQRGGEDAVVEAEATLLREHGHEVTLYSRHNDEVAGLSRLALARDTLWSPRTGRDLQALISQHRPGVVHVHNSFPLVSPSVYWAAARAGLPVVQTLHNFRLLCPQALLLREGRICEDCVGRVPWRAVQHGCYRGSAVQSAAVAGMLQLHRGLGTWQRQVTLYIALNAFCRDKFIEGGLPAERIRIKPNFIDLPAPAPQSREGFLFVGRFSLEKGLEVLAQALALAPPGTALHAAGSGPDAGLLEGAPGVQLLGPLPPASVYAQMARRRALVLPSIWYENFPRTLVEAFANGLPVIASRLGAMATLVEDGVTGLLFRPGDAADLAAKLAWAEAHPAEMQRMGDQARRHYEAELTGPANLQQLRAIYAEAMTPSGKL